MEKQLYDKRKEMFRKTLIGRAVQKIQNIFERITAKLGKESNSK